MVMTPEDVVNKRFSPTRFHQGYDQDEVDDFLDEVVNELRRLGQENDELRFRLSVAAQPVEPDEPDEPDEQHEPRTAQSPVDPPAQSEPLHSAPIGRRSTAHAARDGQARPDGQVRPVAQSFGGKLAPHPYASVQQPPTSTGPGQQSPRPAGHQGLGGH